MRYLAAIVASCAALLVCCGSASALGVTWMPGYRAPDTPAKYDKVGVIKVGPKSAKNVLVLEPGTSAGSAYFVPLAKWIVATVQGWQVWSVERRENLLEDQSVLDRAKEGKASATELFNYYLGYLLNPKIKRHFSPVPESQVEFAKQWGMKVAVQDLHHVIEAAKKRGGKVVLGGHSLGGAVVTAYATWNFHGRPGADALAGLVYIDGGSLPAVSSRTASTELQSFDQPRTSPWLAFGGIPAVLYGVFNATGSTAAVIDPNGQSLGQSSGLLTPFHLAPPVKVTNLAQYGYALNVKTSPHELIAAQAHLGRGISARAKHGVHGWDGRGALTPIRRYAMMFSGTGVHGADGTEWYFPERLTIDTGAVDNGNANPAQKVLDVDSTMGRRLPKRLLIYAFGAALGRNSVLIDARQLAEQSHIPTRHLILIDRQNTYAHNDPAGAYPHNVFFSHLVRFLKKV